MSTEEILAADLKAVGAIVKRVSPRSQEQDAAVDIMLGPIEVQIQVGRDYWCVARTLPNGCIAFSPEFKMGVTARRALMQARKLVASGPR